MEHVGNRLEADGKAFPKDKKEVHAFIRDHLNEDERNQIIDCFFVD
jgi:hypothetical protein